MGIARDRAVLALSRDAAFRLWLDTARWPAFVDGLGRIDRRHERWPEPGATVVWQSRPGGRGTVTVKVLEIEPPARVALQVFDDQLSGVETATFEADGDGSAIQVELDYELSEGGPIRALADVLFIRRSLRDSIRRTLARFAIEAAEDAALERSG